MLKPKLLPLVLARVVFWNQEQVQERLSHAMNNTNIRSDIRSMSEIEIISGTGTKVIRLME